MPIADAMCSSTMMSSYFTWHALQDFPGEMYFIPKKVKTLQSGCEVYFACKGEFVGINTACLECDLAHEVIQKMYYEGES